MANYRPLDQTTLADLAEIFGPNLLAGDGLPESYAHDESGLSRQPEAAVLAENPGQIAALLRLANERRFPVVPRGAGTGLAGGALAEYGGVVLSLEKMNRILTIDPANLLAVVEPGVLTKTLRDAAREHGLFYPPDPASLDVATIGGNAATDAGGPACVKYGVTKDYVLGLEAVLPNGEIIATGVKTRKGVVGYDLTRLLVGSEGTLAVITKLFLKLIPHPEASASLAALFPDARTAAAAVGAIMSRGICPSAVEFMDHACLRLAADLLPFPLPQGAPALLLIETDGDREQTARDMDRIREICRESRAGHILPAPTEADRETIWKARRQISLRIHEACPVYLPEDVVTPIAAIPDLIDALAPLEKQYDLTIYAFGHAGDGNIHLNVTADDPAKAQRAEESLRPLLQTVLDMGGSISGEHGLGLAKKPFADMELSKESLRLQRGLKALFDPNAILNPGKLF